MYSTFKTLIDRFRPIKKWITIFELPVVGVTALFDLVSLLLDKKFKQHAHKHWLRATVLTAAFIVLATATSVGFFLGTFGLAFPILYLHLTLLGAAIKAHKLYTDYATKKADRDPKQAAKRRRYEWFELGLKVTACVAVGLLLFVPGMQEVMASALIVIGIVALVAAIKRPKQEKNWDNIKPAEEIEMVDLSGKSPLLVNNLELVESQQSAYTGPLDIQSNSSEVLNASAPIHSP